ncbi:MAG TPA: ribonuclease III [Candidatus Aphodoplasma excrementigallinarum]|uniref:Ribonuclease 3 n=1 Tax=Candidatus Aphodoplasma excrementigallinarum TaxID=2840673 RepID=A0A9D1T015_9FIRM|nr:ribonuclease III [Candidatus Aphodoplasma excrementigallinarum]
MSSEGRGGHSKAHLAEFEKIIGYSFKDKALLRHALSHTSYTNEHGLEKHASNERLEFLGDAIVDMVVSDYLYRHSSTEPEGTLTKWRASVVCESSFAHIAAGMDYGAYLLLGKGEEATGGRSRSSVLADAFEAVIAAIYLDSDIQTVSDWIIRHLKEEIALAVEGKTAKDYKTLLQELVQKGERGKVSYRVTDERGPDHAKMFCVEVLIDGQRVADGSGTSKKDAEQAAAGAAVKAITKRR